MKLKTKREKLGNGPYLSEESLLETEYSSSIGFYKRGKLDRSMYSPQDTQQLPDYQAQNRKLKQTIETLTSEYALQKSIMRQQIQVLKQELCQKDDYIKELNVRISELQIKISEFQRQTKRKNENLMGKIMQCGEIVRQLEDQEMKTSTHNMLQSSRITKFNLGGEQEKNTNNSHGHNNISQIQANTLIGKYNQGSTLMVNQIESEGLIGGPVQRTSQIPDMFESPTFPNRPNSFNSLNSIISNQQIPPVLPLQQNGISPSYTESIVIQQPNIIYQQVQQQHSQHQQTQHQQSTSFISNSPPKFSLNNQTAHKSGFYQQKKTHVQEPMNSELTNYQMQKISNQGDRRSINQQRHVNYVEVQTKANPQGDKRNNITKRQITKRNSSPAIVFNYTPKKTVAPLTPVFNSQKNILQVNTAFHNLTKQSINSPTHASHFSNQHQNQNHSFTSPSLHNRLPKPQLNVNQANPLRNAASPQRMSLGNQAFSQINYLPLGQAIQQK